MRYRARAAILEAVSLVGVSAVLGLAVNTWSDTGLALGKNHFRVPPPTASHDGGVSAPTDPAVDYDEQGGMNEAALAHEGYQVIAHEDVIETFQGVAYLEEQHIIIDARDDMHYAEGHIPGAYQLDHYRAERYLEDLVPICQNASRIVVYCNGGRCDDSKLAAGTLMDNGVDPQKIFIYLGGATAWVRDGLAMESGERNSGQTVYLEAEEE